MKNISILRLGENEKIKENTSITIGNFDGVHKAHKKLIEMAIGCGKSFDGGLKTLVLSFYPHPVAFFRSGSFKPLVTSEEKQLLLNQLDVDFFVEFPFEEVVTVEPEQFFKEILIDKLGCKALTVGEDYRFGKNRAGDINLLKQLGEKYGVTVNVMSDIYYEGRRISSTAIRECIEKKDFELAEKMLARPYFAMGKVTSGKSIGRTIGFPTLNISTHEDKLYPSNGVYITTTEHGGYIYKSITNIGVKPTVGENERVIETFLFDFSGNDLYGEEIVVNFHKWVRDEKKFGDVSELKEQIAKDKAVAERFFDTW